MTNRETSEEWLKRALSNLTRARNDKVAADILFEDLCFDCQQAAEKALKALLACRDIAFPRTHSIGLLLELLEQSNLTIPADVKMSVILTDFAVTTRYPGDYEPVTAEEYRDALAMAETVFQWVKEAL